MWGSSDVEKGKMNSKVTQIKMTRTMATKAKTFATPNELTNAKIMARTNNPTSSPIPK
jgi:hypothetical protein